jgi:hypothetical protein
MQCLGRDATEKRTAPIFHREEHLTHGVTLRMSSNGVEGKEVVVTRRKARNWSRNQLDSFVLN